MGRDQQALATAGKEFHEIETGDQEGFQAPIEATGPPTSLEPRGGRCRQHAPSLRCVVIYIRVLRLSPEGSDCCNGKKTQMQEYHIMVTFVVS